MSSLGKMFPKNTTQILVTKKVRRTYTNKKLVTNAKVFHIGGSEVAPWIIITSQKGEIVTPYVPLPVNAVVKRGES